MKREKFGSQPLCSGYEWKLQHYYYLCLIELIDNFPSNTEEKSTTLNDEKSFAVAERLADFQYSGSHVKNNIYIFQGSENPLIMSRVYDINWICDYDMG